MSPRTRLATVLASCLFVACSLVACSGGADTPLDRVAPSGTSGVSALMSQSASDGLLQRMVGASMRVPHHGVRRVSATSDIEGVATSLAYTERVSCDGRRAAIEPLELETPALGATQRELFLEIQRARMGFFLRYRDFALRDLSLFLSNYEVRAFGDVSVAGVPCVDLQLQRRDGTRNVHRVAVHAPTGLVVRAIEEARDGRELARSEFVELALAAPIDDVVYFEDRYPGLPLDGGTALPFALATPQVLPVGFQHLQSDVVHENGETFVRRVYGDGLETLFFLQAPAQTRPVFGGVATPLKPSADPTVLRVARVGSWTLAELARPESSFFVVGKVSEDEVLTMVSSAL